MPHYLETSSKKLQVIQTAIQLFTTRGFHTSGVDLIAKEANITKSTFYKYFGSKERLVEMCIAFQKACSEKKCLPLFTQAVTTRQKIKSKKLSFYIPI